MVQSTLFKVLVTAALLLAGGGFLVYSSLDDAQYYEMVDKVAAHPENYLGKDLKLHGYVVADSIVDEQKTEHTFALEMNSQHIDIHFVGEKPDNLKNRAEVVAVGHLTRDDAGHLVFNATELMAKCPSKYQGAQANKDLF
jgi:cytochrome c-type biogenesis protein CcmE